MEVHYTLSLTSALDGDGWSTPGSGRITPGKETRYQSHRRLCGPQDRSGLVRKISPDKSARSESLYLTRLDGQQPHGTYCRPAAHWQVKCRCNSVSGTCCISHGVATPTSTRHRPQYKTAGRQAVRKVSPNLMLLSGVVAPDAPWEFCCTVI